MPGLLVVVEGIIGVGKTSIIAEVVNQLECTGLSVVVYKFPDRQSLYDSRIDRYLKGELTLTSKYDVRHMLTTNRHHVSEKIKADIDEDKVVICDHYVFSAIAYQIPPHVIDQLKIGYYCYIIRYFDKEMPLPDIVYLIEGDHLHRRGIFKGEIFHHSGSKAQKLKNMTCNVIRNYISSFAVRKNNNGRMSEVVNFIVHDIHNCYAYYGFQ